jgi:hypothetical protein
LLRIIGRKLAILLLIIVSTAGAFATLGDGTIKRDKSIRSKSLLTNKTQASSFSLRSGYSFRGAQVINTQSERFVNLNTVLTYQKGSTTYILPLKKKVLLDNVKIDLSNRQFRRN